MLIFRSAKTGISELALNASYRMHVNSTIGSSAPFTTKSPPPQPVAHRRAGVTLLSRLHVESSRSSAQHLFSLHGHLNKSLKNSSPLFFIFFYELIMTFRRLKKVNSSGPDSGPSSQDNDIYFPSSKSDSCRTMDSPSNSSEVYNYKTLAYSGGTLPRNFKKVKKSSSF